MLDPEWLVAVISYHFIIQCFSITRWNALFICCCYWALSLYLTGSVQDLTWDVERSLLFSASFDNSIICWDIGGQKGVAYDLNGHR